MAGVESVHDESMPLLGKPPKKPFYRARPLWLVPFAILASLTRGMTLAPRLEVFTQISCNTLYGHHKWNHTQSPSPSLYSSSHISNVPLHASIDPLGPHFYPYILPERGVTFIQHLNDQLEVNVGRDEDTDSEVARRAARCLSDPAVQAGAARLQTIMTTTMGLLSALTTGWWGHFGERHGRTRVLALSTLGLFISDLIFILVSTPSSPLSNHGYKLLLVAPVIEGLLGGYSMVQSATSAYLSDCTSSGSRAQIFSRFTGAISLGLCLGPAVGGWLIRHPIGWIGASSTPGRQSVTSVFWAATFCAFINLLLVTFVFPESLDKEKRDQAMIAYQKLGTIAGKKGKARERALPFYSSDSGSSSMDEEDSEEQNRSGQEERASGFWSRAVLIIRRFLSPLALFYPVVVLDSSGLGRKRRDWSLTLLAGALCACMLSSGVYQMKYLYARHTYGWGAEQLSYYVSFMGGSRAMFLLLLLPTIISFVKPKPLPPPDQKGKGKAPVLNNPNKNSNTGYSATVQQPQSEQQQQPLNGKKPKPTRAQLGQEIGFDLFLARFSLMIDILSQTLVVLFPAPTFKVDNVVSHMSLMQTAQSKSSLATSQSMFVLASSLSSMGSGVVPAVHSLALCLLQVRGMDDAAIGNAAGEDPDVVETREGGTGALFGAFAVLQAVGQTILGPMIFGLVYIETVAMFPKAIFTVAAGFLVCAFMMVLFVRNPVRPVYSGRSKGKRREGRDVERGRSRVSKDLRGGAIVYYRSKSSGSYDAGR